MIDISRVLDDCLERVRSGQPLETVLRDHPAMADRLRPLIQAGLAVSDLSPSPSTELRMRARAELLTAIRARPRTGRARSSAFVRRFAFGLAAAALALISFGTAAAQSSLPGDWLFGWKISSEQAWRSVNPDPFAIDLALLDRRTREWIAVRGRPDIEAIAQSQFSRVASRLAAAEDRQASQAAQRAITGAAAQLEAAGIHVDLQAVVPGLLPEPPWIATPLPILPDLDELDLLPGG
jgi:hypothetical protein